MKINLSPQRRDDDLPVITLVGTTLTINGDELDLADIPAGATYPNANELNDWLTGAIEHKDGDFELTILLPHGPDAEQWQTFPEPIITTGNGPVDLPFNTYSETVIEDVDGGTNYIITTYRWHQPDEVVTTFYPAPPEETEE